MPRGRLRRVVDGGIGELVADDVVAAPLKRRKRGRSARITVSSACSPLIAVPSPTMLATVSPLNSRRFRAKRFWSSIRSMMLRYCG
jgi:hypothetical protein